VPSEALAHKFTPSAHIAQGSQNQHLPTDQDRSRLYQHGSRRSLLFSSGRLGALPVSHTLCGHHHVPRHVGQVERLRSVQEEQNRQLQRLLERIEVILYPFAIPLPTVHDRLLLLLL